MPKKPANPGVKCEILDEGTIIGDKILSVGDVVLLTEEVRDAHRERGVSLGDVPEDDKREVHDLVHHPTESE